MLIKRVIGVFLFILFFVCPVAAQSPSPPQEIIKSAPKQEGTTPGSTPTQTGQHQKNPTNHKDTANKPTVTVEKTKPKKEDSPTQNSANNEDENLKIQRQLAESTKTIADFTIALVLVGALQAIILLVQILLWRGTLKATKKAADAAKDSADALPAIERAYLFVKVDPIDELYISGTPHHFDMGENRGDILITNYGKTPAILINIFDIVDIIDAQIQKLPDIGLGIDREIPPETVIGVDSGVNNTMILPVKFIINNKEILHDIYNGASIFISQGCIKYKDIFGNHWETRFCWEYSYSRHAFFPVEDDERNKRT